MSNGESLVVASVQKNNEGNFTCVAENVAGTARDSIMLYVQGERERERENEMCKYR